MYTLHMMRSLLDPGALKSLPEVEGVSLTLPFHTIQKTFTVAV